MLSISSKKSQEVQFPNYHPFLLSPLPTNYNDMRLCIMIQMMTTGTWHSQSMNKYTKCHYYKQRRANGSFFLYQ